MSDRGNVLERRCCCSGCCCLLAGGRGCCWKRPSGGDDEVGGAGAAVAVVHGCLLEIADVQILSQGDCLAKNLTISRFPIERQTHVSFLIYFWDPFKRGNYLNSLVINKLN